mmetsp:Transcript_35528/g.82962  ORF Transcript_35528/g.82962 Transcript_35528/m.82962 type:complete len:320 (-) Transcript_35528:41-1000(-)
MSVLKTRASCKDRENIGKVAVTDVELQRDTNVLLVPYLQSLAHKAFVNQILSLGAISFAAVSIVLIILLSYPDRPCVDEKDTDCEATPRVIFHNLEFWATFFFSVIEVIAIRYSPRNSAAIYKYSNLLKFMVALNVGVALCSATLVAINLERFEFAAHQMEYSHALLAAAVDVILIASLVKDDGGVVKGGNKWVAYAGFGFSALCVCAAISQLVIYNSMGKDEDGVPIGETPAHFIEFSFDFMSAIILYWFCIDNAFRCDMEQLHIMLVKDREIRVSIVQPVYSRYERETMAAKFGSQLETVTERASQPPTIGAATVAA